ncbi:alpha/beta fold hydrolase [Pseudonocardia lacus]|uniref:alpha/beta fold hydrolase n=1 Tax=Pseudonocardia lacus TaxID=2835865 RepID=UPI001BDD4766|nr:alpha/beta hydrolase [Pseudonocardia lacus]
MPFHTAADGTRLFHLDVGDGPPVLLVHGWSLSSAMWEYQVRALVTAGFRCVAMDRRGHGRSDVPGAGYDIDTLADDLTGLVEHLDLRGVTAVAHSMGTCEVTRWLARTGTDRVARAAFLGAMTPHLVGAVGAAFVDAIVDALVADRPRWFQEGAPGYFATAGTGSWVSQALIDDGIRTILTTPLEVQIACLRTFATTDLTADLQAIDVPVLVLHGDADASAPIDLTGRPTAKLLRNGRLRLVEGAPHGMYVTARSTIDAELLAFAG